MITKSRLTVAEFEDIAGRVENADKRLEFIGGEVIEVVSNSYSSIIAARILGELSFFLKGKNLGWLTGADGGYVVADDRCIPDVAFISRARQPKPPHEVYTPLAPDLAVEVVSPSDVPSDITDKVVGYLAAQTVVWVIYPDKQQAKVYEPNQPPQTITLEGALVGGKVLPGFVLPLKDIFAD